MEWLALIWPLAAAAVLKWYFRHKIVWWEMVLPLLPLLIIVPVSKIIAETAVTRDVERWGGWTTEVWYYEEWDEWVTETCSRSVPCGTDSKGNTNYCTEYYDCSYRDYHPEYWELRGSNGETIQITRQRYDQLVAYFKVKPVFVDMRRDYYHIDGDAYTATWPGTSSTLQPLFTDHTYTNRVQAAQSVFTFPKITPEEAAQKGLYDWPALTTPFHSAAVLGPTPGREQADKLLQYWNATLGARYQIRIWLLVWKNKPQTVMYDQQAYWKGGNKNELVLCVGLDDDNQVEWADGFCWSPDGYAGNDALIIEWRDYIYDLPTMATSAAATKAAELVPQYWRRKPFAEFSYLKVELGGKVLIVIHILTILSTAGTLWIAVHNEHTEDNTPLPWETTFGRR